MIRLSGRFVPVRVDAESQAGRALARRYGVRAFPTVLFLRPSGEVAGFVEGFLPAAPFAAEMRRALERASAKRASGPVPGRGAHGRAPSGREKSSSQS